MVDFPVESVRLGGEGQRKAIGKQSRGKGRRCGIFYHHQALISTSQLVVATAALKHLFFILWIIFCAPQIGAKSVVIVSLEFTAVLIP